MTQHDVVVVGGGISGLAFAHEAARAGRSVLVLERASRLGGCVATHRSASGYWFELGAHTCYRSYAGLAAILERCGLRGDVIARARTRLRFLDGDDLLPGSNLGALLRQLSLGELLGSLPRMASTVRAGKEGETVYAYYSRIFGRRNYSRVVGPMLSAVPSQSADAFPAAMLFKSRGARRRDFPRSFTLRGGLRAVVDGIASQPGIEVALERTVTQVDATSDGWSAVTDGGEEHAAPVVAIAAPPGVAARLLADASPELATTAARVHEATVESTGVTVRASKVPLPLATFLIPRDDLFHSAVSRDAVPDPEWRAFAFHFRPGLARDERVERVAQVLKVGPADLEEVVERRHVLPSPVLGHQEIVGEIDRLVDGSRLALAGNWFAGLSLEDCVHRARSEWTRVAALDS